MGRRPAAPAGGGQCQFRPRRHRRRPCSSTKRQPSPESVSSPAPPAAAAPTLRQRLFAGNILAKIGVVLLFFGVASALRLAGGLRLSAGVLRLLLGAVAGLAMIAFGWHKVRAGSHQTFGVAIQGSGFAILYLIVHASQLARSCSALLPLLYFRPLFFSVVRPSRGGSGGRFFSRLRPRRRLCRFRCWPPAAVAIPCPVRLFALLNAFIVSVSWSSDLALAQRHRLFVYPRRRHGLGSRALPRQPPT